MTRIGARNLGEQAAARCRVMFDEGVRRLNLMGNDDDLSSPRAQGQSYQDLSAEKRAVIDEVMAAANEMSKD